jgi:ABC-type multidrug transport system fused ATPase/permease subunit
LCSLLLRNMMNNSYQALQGLITSFTRSAAAAEKVFGLIDSVADIGGKGGQGSGGQEAGDGSGGDSEDDGDGDDDEDNASDPIRTTSSSSSFLSASSGTTVKKPPRTRQGRAAAAAAAGAAEEGGVNSSSVAAAGLPIPIDWPSFKGEFTLKQVSYFYQMRPDKLVLNGLSLVVPGGSVCALVGRSGGGKSTVISMLMRFYDPRR